jgi:hypothetical protein
MKKNNPTPLNDDVLAAFEAARQTPSLQPEVQRRLKNEFLTQIQQARPQSVTFSQQQRLNQQKTSNNSLVYRWRTCSMTVKIISILIAVTILLGGAGAGTVMASQSALPDEALYPLKRWSEEVRLDLTSQPDKQLALHLDMADRRADEMVTLLAAGVPFDQELRLVLLTHLWMASQLTESCEDPLLAQARVQSRLMAQEMKLTNAPEDALMTQTRSVLRQQIRLMDCTTEECSREVCEGGGCMISEQLMTADQIREQLRIDQPEGAGSETGNGYTGEYPEPQQGKPEDSGGGWLEDAGTGSDNGAQNGGQQEKAPGYEDNNQGGSNGNGK